ncbi:MAG: peptidoglycan endopeptidase [Polymorphobacter sp.]
MGTRFRPHGRVPGLGLDCVGLVLVAGGVDAGLMPVYALGGDHRALLDIALQLAGCQRVASALPGDVLVLSPAPRALHLAIVTPDGVVQAHAGLGRVVEGPLDPAWPCLAVWRFTGAR